MKTQTMPKTLYVQQYGYVSRRTGSAFDPENLELWEKVKKLSVSDYLILEFDKGAEIKKERNKFAGLMNRMRKKFFVKFIIRAVANQHERHLVVWKESLPENGK